MGALGKAEWFHRAISSAVERLPYKQDVAGSKPASRIIKSLASTKALADDVRVP